MSSAERQRALAVTTKGRAPQLRNVPTLEEEGLKVVDIVTFNGIVAPRKTPAAIIARLNTALNQSLHEPEVVKQLGEISATAKPGRSADFESFLNGESSTWGALIKELDIKAD